MPSKNSRAHCALKLSQNEITKILKSSVTSKSRSTPIKNHFGKYVRLLNVKNKKWKTIESRLLNNVDICEKTGEITMMSLGGEQETFKVVATGDTEDFTYRSAAVKGQACKTQAKKKVSGKPKPQGGKKKKPRAGKVQISTGHFEDLQSIPDFGANTVQILPDTNGCEIAGIAEENERGSPLTSAPCEKTANLEKTAASPASKSASPRKTRSSPAKASSPRKRGHTYTKDEIIEKMEKHRETFSPELIDYLRLLLSKAADSLVDKALYISIDADTGKKYWYPATTTFPDFKFPLRHLADLILLIVRRARSMNLLKSNSKLLRMKAELDDSLVELCNQSEKQIVDGTKHKSHPFTAGFRFITNLYKTEEFIKSHSFWGRSSRGSIKKGLNNEEHDVFWNIRDCVAWLCNYGDIDYELWKTNPCTLFNRLSGDRNHSETRSGKALKDKSCSTGNHQAKEYEIILLSDKDDEDADYQFEIHELPPAAKRFRKTPIKAPVEKISNSTATATSPRSKSKKKLDFVSPIVLE